MAFPASKASAMLLSRGQAVDQMVSAVGSPYVNALRYSEAAEHPAARRIQCGVAFLMEQIKAMDFSQDEARTTAIAPLLRGFATKSWSKRRGFMFQKARNTTLAMKAPFFGLGRFPIETRS